MNYYSLDPNVARLGTCPKLMPLYLSLPPFDYHCYCTSLLPNYSGCRLWFPLLLNLNYIELLLFIIMPHYLNFLKKFNCVFWELFELIRLELRLRAWPLAIVSIWKALGIPGVLLLTLCCLRPQKTSMRPWLPWEVKPVIVLVIGDLFKIYVVWCSGIVI